LAGESWVRFWRALTERSSLRWDSESGRAGRTIQEHWFNGAGTGARRHRIVSETVTVIPNVDAQGNAQPGRIYEFTVPAPDGGTRTIQLRDDATGHFYGPSDLQNRGPHFNDPSGRHFDYPQ
jgi:hypothetical protein